MSAVEDRRAALRETLIDAAERRVEADGLASIRARDLAKEAGCSVGAIYNIFDDLDALILAVNLRTFAKMGTEIRQAMAEAGDVPPAQRMIVMANAYLDYASAHPRRWRTLFDFKMSTESDVPEWYLKALGELFELIATPLRELFPEAEPERIDMLTRGLFSSVHGIVLLGVESRISGVPRARLEEMIAFIITAASDATLN